MTDPTDDLAARVPGPRHAAPRVSARSRLRGRALAIAAVPTALLMGAVYAPSLAVAADSAKGCATAPDSTVYETPVPKSELTPIPGPTATPTKSTTTSTPTAPAPTASVPTAPKAAVPRVAAAPATVPAPAPAPTATPTAAAQSKDLIGDILNIFNPAGPTPTPTATPKPTATPTAAPKPTVVPSAPGSLPSSTTPAGAAAPAAGAPASGAGTSAKRAVVAPSPSASPTKNPNCLVDTRAVTAKSAESGRTVPEQNWTLRSSVLGLHGAVFEGVVDVHTPTTTKRVLKFVVDSVDIGDLDMSTKEVAGKTFHVKGAPGSTSTMRKGPVTMYVESLSGHLSKIEGLPIIIDLGQITLTPDTLPQWLYDLIGAVPIPLDLEMKQVTAIQAGQFGGTLKIPGMQLYNDDLPY